jgi:predicted dehydrogenase
MSTPPLRVGIVGCGAVTERYHLPALQASPDVEVVAYADPAVSRARALAKGRGDGTALAVPSHLDLLGKIDLAVVAVPNAFHEQVAVDLLQAGVHTLVEKPMARSAAECDRMIAAAGTAGAVLAVGHDFRYFPIAKYARDLFAGGLLGKVRRVDVRQSAGGRWPYTSTAALLPSAGGGVLIDFGVHILDLLLWWFGDLRPLAYHDDAAGGIETESELELELPGGVPVHIDLSRTRVLRDTVIVGCERGSAEIGVFEPAVIRLSLDGAGQTLTCAVPDPEFERAPLRTVFGRQLADVVVAIRGGPAPLVGGPDGRRVVALVEACYAARQPLSWPWDVPLMSDAVGRMTP